jgi:hypothetical protein
VKRVFVKTLVEAALPLTTVPSLTQGLKNGLLEY